MNPLTTPRYRVVDRLAVEIHPTRATLGLSAARAVAAYLQETIAERGEARVIFACAPSQDEFLAALTSPERCGTALDWSRVTAFHMDDYVGLQANDPQSFRHYLQQHLLSRVPIERFHPIPAENPNAAAVCARYSALLRERPIDLICLGIGENGHIAFNDPPVADFDELPWVKVVELDATCRIQQVNDGCFPSFAEVPRHAFTLSVPVFRHARRLSIHVPGERKATAVRATLRDEISVACPATILRTHPAATLYLDTASARTL